MSPKPKIKKSLNMSYSRFVVGHPEAGFASHVVMLLAAMAQAHASDRMSKTSSSLWFRVEFSPWEFGSLDWVRAICVDFEVCRR